MDGGGGGVISGQSARMPAIITGCARSAHVCPSAPRLAPRKNMGADRLQNWPPPADEYFSSIGAGGRARGAGGGRREALASGRNCAAREKTFVTDRRGRTAQLSSRL
jgi:hypothetical protein